MTRESAGAFGLRLLNVWRRKKKLHPPLFFLPPHSVFLRLIYEAPSSSSRHTPSFQDSSRSPLPCPAPVSRRGGAVARRASADGGLPFHRLGCPSLHVSIKMECAPCRAARKACSLGQAGGVVPCDLCSRKRIRCEGQLAVIGYLSEIAFKLRLGGCPGLVNNTPGSGSPRSKCFADSGNKSKSRTLGILLHPSSLSD